MATQIRMRPNLHIHPTMLGHTKGVSKHGNLYHLVLRRIQCEISEFILLQSQCREAKQFGPYEISGQYLKTGEPLN